MAELTKTVIEGYKRGVDDLKGLFAFRGAETGMFEYGTNDISQYVPGARLIFVFDCEISEEAIAKEVEERRKWNENYINQLKEEGRFEEPYSITITSQYNEALDNVVPKHLDSYKMLIENFGEIDLWSFK